MALFGSSWKDDIKGDDDAPMIGHNWTDKSEDVFPIPEPDVRQLLDKMTDTERLEIFSHYCKHCGAKRPTSECYCYRDD